ncbi:hypothetical protein EXQ39_06750 [Clostridium botulinum]|nr:hypothetical protein [Clostridium botulinum]
MFALDAFLFNKYSHLTNYIQKYRTVINISKISKDDLENSIAVFQILDPGMNYYGGNIMGKTELQKAWEEFILAVAKELRIIKFLNWIIKKIND